MQPEQQQDKYAHLCIHSSQGTAAVKSHTHLLCFHCRDLTTSYATLSWKNERQSSCSNWVTTYLGERQPELTLENCSSADGKNNVLIWWVLFLCDQIICSLCHININTNTNDWLKNHCWNIEAFPLFLRSRWSPKLIKNHKEACQMLRGTDLFVSLTSMIVSELGVRAWTKRQIHIEIKLENMKKESHIQMLPESL